MKRLPLLILPLLLLLSACASAPGTAPADASSAPDTAPSLVVSPTLMPAGSPSPGAGPSPSPAPVGQTLDELRDSVTVELDPGTLSENRLGEYEEVPKDVAAIVQASAWQWMRYVFTEMERDGERAPELRDFRCTSLKLIDISEDQDLFIYSAVYHFLPYSDSGAEFWMPGNTQPSDEPGGWYRFSRQLAVRVDNDSWEVISVGTGGMSLSDFTGS